MKRKLAAFVLLMYSMGAQAAPISFGALSSDDDGSTEVIIDTLNQREWLRWDVLDELTYAETVAAISEGGAYEGWQIAGIQEAQQFVEALLFGLENDCTEDQPSLVTCAEGIADGLTALLGNNFESEGTIDYTVAWFLSDDNLPAEDQETGYIEYFYRPAQSLASRVAKLNNYRSISHTDQASSSGGAPFITWLLYRERATPVEIDIKPDSDTNCIEQKAWARIPVAILGRPDFDPSNINVESLKLDSCDTRVRSEGTPLCWLDDVNDDQVLDLHCKFTDRPVYWNEGEGTATLTGELQDGTKIEGTDSICAVAVDPSK